MLRVIGLVGVMCVVLGVTGCPDSNTTPPKVDARPDSSPPSPDAGPDTRPADTATDLPPGDAPRDTVADSPAADATIDGALPADTGPDVTPIVHSCGAFSAPSMWTTATGFRSAVVATGTPLNQPVAISFAAGAYGEFAYVVDQGARALFKVNTMTGAVTPFVATDAWPRAPGLLTTSVWDADNAFDGRLYIGDQGGDGDADSVIFRVDAAGTGHHVRDRSGPGHGRHLWPRLLARRWVRGRALRQRRHRRRRVGFGRFDSAGTGATFAMFGGDRGPGRRPAGPVRWGAVRLDAGERRLLRR